MSFLFARLLFQPHLYYVIWMEHQFSKNLFVVKHRLWIISMVFGSNHRKPRSNTPSSGILAEIIYWVNLQLIKKGTDQFLKHCHFINSFLLVYCPKLVLQHIYGYGSYERKINYTYYRATSKVLGGYCDTRATISVWNHSAGTESATCRKIK